MIRSYYFFNFTFHLMEDCVSPSTIPDTHFCLYYSLFLRTLLKQIYNFLLNERFIKYIKEFRNKNI